MESNTIVFSLIKGIIAAIIIFLITKVILIIEWLFDAPAILNYSYFIVQSLLIGIVIKNKSLRLCGLSCIGLIIAFILLEILLPNINEIIFKRLFGSEVNMGAGDGFMILSVYTEVILSSVAGMLLSFFLTGISAQVSKRQFF